MLTIMASEMSEFFQILIYGDASLLFLLIFMGLAFLISWKVRPFALVSMVACLFMAREYASQNPNLNYIWHIVLLMVAMPIFLMRLANKGMFKD